MLGMDRNTGKPLSGDAHIVQSVSDIITTPIGTRCGKMRDYGSIVPMLQDQPITRATPLLVASGVASALARWEKRVSVKRVAVTGEFARGQAVLTIDLVRRGTASNALTTITIPLSI